MSSERKARQREGFTVFPVEVHRATMVARLIAEGHLRPGAVTYAEICAAMSAHFLTCPRILATAPSFEMKPKKSDRSIPGKALVTHGAGGWAFNGDPDYVQQHERRMTRERRRKASLERRKANLEKDRAPLT